MVELVSLKGIAKESKVQILKKLGYDSDGNIVLKKDKKPFIDKYTNNTIKLEDMLILPGSAIVLSNDELSLIGYMEEYGDIF